MADEQADKRSGPRKALAALRDGEQYAVLWGEWRRGLKDLQNAVLDPWNGVTQKHEEPGTIASPTQAEITAERGNVQGYGNLLDGYAARGIDSTRDGKGMER
jgi:hypothetical protein